MVEDTDEPRSWPRLYLRETGVSNRRIRAEGLGIGVGVIQFGLRGAGIWFRFRGSVDDILVFGIVVVDKRDVGKLFVCTTVKPSTSKWS